jgi:hypothetical protein
MILPILLIQLSVLVILVLLKSNSSAQLPPVIKNACPLLAAMISSFKFSIHLTVVKPFFCSNVS